MRFNSLHIHNSAEQRRRERLFAYSPAHQGTWPGLAVALAALPAARIGEPPRLVRAEPLVAGDDLPGDLRDPDQRAAQLARRSAGRHKRGAYLLAAGAGLGDLGKGELRGGIFQDSFRGFPLAWLMLWTVR